ncbi:hypothetical protein C2W62_06270 [Candidatus Entotheonella serta]|nr:hypothetical protein C2W62_06270 [Candidatus Entotheonella serta]
MKSILLLKKRSKSSSINRRFIYTFVSVIILVIACLATITMYIRYAKINYQLERRLDYIITFSQESLKIPLSQFSKTMIEGFLDALLLDKSIVYINVSRYGHTNDEHQIHDNNLISITKIQNTFNKEDLSDFEQSSRFLMRTSDIFYQGDKRVVPQ